MKATSFGLPGAIHGIIERPASYSSTLCGLSLNGLRIKTAHPNVVYAEEPGEVYKSHRVTNRTEFITCGECTERVKQ